MKLASLVLCTGAAFGQIPVIQEATVALAHVPTPEAVKQMTTIVRIAGMAREATFDEAHSAFTVRGPANVLGLAEWLLHAMDKPVGWRPAVQELENPSSREYHLPKGSERFDEREPVARICYLTSTRTPQGLQEILTAVRVVSEIHNVFEFDGPPMMIFRGTATTVELGEWMSRKLDVPAGGAAFARQNENPGNGVFRLPNKADRTEDIVRIFYVDPAMSPQVLNMLTTKIRVTTKTGKIFQKTSPPAITIRGNSALLAQAQQIVESR